MNIKKILLYVLSKISELVAFYFTALCFKLFALHEEPGDLINLQRILPFGLMMLAISFIVDSVRAEIKKEEPPFRAPMKHLVENLTNISIVAMIPTVIVLIF